MGDGILSETFPEIREAVRRLCARFPGEYWQKLDRERAYPSEFVAALTEAGFLSVLIPEEYGGSGLGISAAAAMAIAPASAAPIAPRVRLRIGPEGPPW